MLHFGQKQSRDLTLSSLLIQSPAQTCRDCFVSALKAKSLVLITIVSWAVFKFRLLQALSNLQFL